MLVAAFLVCREAGAFGVSRGGGTAKRAAGITQVILFLAVTLGSMGMGYAMARQRVRGIGPGMFFEYALEPKADTDGFFRGLRVGKVFKETYAQVAEVVSRLGSSSIFFGPRMQWGYAAFGRSSPVQQPAWWDPGVSFPRQDEAKYTQAFLKSRFQVLVFLKDDMTYYPLGLIEAIREAYEEDQALSRLTVFRLKQ